MQISGFSEYPFRSYDKNADLPEEVVIRQIILYGEIKDMIRLVHVVNNDKIRQETDRMLRFNPGNFKRVNF